MINARNKIPFTFMKHREKIKILKPKIIIEKGQTPLLFIDTFMWHRLLTTNDKEKELLQECCNAHSLVVAITNAIEGELKQRNIFRDVCQICRDSLVTIPIGIISANQTVQAMVCYFEGKRKVILNWDLMTSDVPVLGSQKTGLKHMTEEVKRELNSARNNFSGNKEQLISIFIGIEREIWKSTLRLYGDLLKPRRSRREDGSYAWHPSYDGFFLTDFFTDLPFAVLKSYLLAYLLNERSIKTEDLVDIYCISELMPYATLFIMDKDQHNRLRQLKKHYPIIFGRLDDLCHMSSFLKDNRSFNPMKALRSFLEYVWNKEKSGLQTCNTNPKLKT